MALGTGEQLLGELGHLAQLVPERLELGLGHGAARPGEAQREEQEGGDLGGVRLGRRHPDLETCAREEHVVGVARGLAAHGRW